jgi:hypothetical protein
MDFGARGETFAVGATGKPLEFVMPRLVPGIHAFLTSFALGLVRHGERSDAVVAGYARP